MINKILLKDPSLCEDEISYNVRDNDVVSTALNSCESRRLSAF